MATSNIPYPQDPTLVGQRAATRTKTEDSVTKHFQRVILETGRTTTFKGVGATFRMPGVATTPHNLFYITNATSSTVLVAIRKLEISVIGTAANTALVTPALFRLTTLPTGGTAFTKTSTDSRDTSSASVIVAGAASADGTASAITGTAVGQRITSGLLPTMVTSGVYPGQRVYDMTSGMDEFPLTLNAQQGYLLQMITASVVTNHYVVEVAWEEYTEF